MSAFLLRRHRRRSTTRVEGDMVTGDAGPLFIRDLQTTHTAIQIARGEDYVYLLAGSAIDLRAHLRAMLASIEGGLD